MGSEIPGFRAGNALAMRFTGTLTERFGEPVERIPTPQRLLDWLELNDLAVQTCTLEELEVAQKLREAVHATATAAALQIGLPAAAVRELNERSSAGGASAYLTSEGERRWRLRPATGIDDALSVIATDAISLLAGERDGRFALCASPTCRAAFFDTSQSRTRRWCDMNTCGNRSKKARFQAKHPHQTSHQRP